MTVLVDTGVLYAAHDTDASRHETAVEALDAVYDGQYGQPFLSDYIYDEVVTLTARRSGDWDVATTVGQKLRGAGTFPTVYEFLWVSESEFSAAVDVFERYDDQRLSFTDASTIALVDRHEIHQVLSFDDDFDGLVDRLAPESL